jgi:hypothetical protein
MTYQSEIEELRGTLAYLSREIQQQVVSLSTSQLNWKPNKMEWSVGQCLDHLIVTNTSYFPQIDQLLAGTKQSTLWERLPLLPTLYGRIMIRILGPESTSRVPAPNAFLPTQSDVQPQIASLFLSMQEEISQRILACQHLPIADIVITSPASNFVIYSLLDAFRIIVVHEQNHFNQLMRLIQHPDFPTA